MKKEKNIRTEEKKEITKETELLEAGYPQKAALSLYDANIRTIGDLIGIYKSALDYIGGIGEKMKEKIIIHTYKLGFVFDEENKYIKKKKIKEETEIWKAGYSSRARLSIECHLAMKGKRFKELNIKNLISINTWEIKRWRNTGKKTYNEIIDHTHELGYKFADEMECYQIISKETLTKQFEICSTPDGKEKLHQTLNILIEEADKKKKNKYLKVLSEFAETYNRKMKELIE